MMVDNAATVTTGPSVLNNSLDESRLHHSTPPKTYREPKSFVSPTVASTANSSSPRHVNFDNYDDDAMHFDNVVNHEELNDVLNRLLPSLDYLDGVSGEPESDNDGPVGGVPALHHPSLDLSALSDSVFEDYHDDRGRGFSADGEFSYADNFNNGAVAEPHCSGDFGGSTAGDSSGEVVDDMMGKVLSAFVDAQKELEEEREKRRQLELENEVMRLRIRTLSSVGSNPTNSRHGSISYAAALNNGVGSSSPSYGVLSSRSRAMTAAVDTLLPDDASMSEVAPPPPGLLEHQVSAPSRYYGLSSHLGASHGGYSGSWDAPQQQRRSSSGALSYHQPVSPTTPPKMNLLEALQVKTEADEKRVFTVRKVHKLGFKARHILREYFSKYGHVRDVVLLPMRAKPRPGPGGIIRGPRPSSMGFVVMSTPEEVRRVLDVDGVHIVRGWPIEVRPFVRPADQAPATTTKVQQQQHEEGEFYDDVGNRISSLSSLSNHSHNSSTPSDVVRSDTE